MKTRTILFVGGLVIFAARAQATPRPLPFSYPYETLPAAGLEIEQVVDMTPIRALDAQGDERWVPRSRLITEIEYGITDRLEAGFYFQLSDAPGSTGGTSLRFDGLKQRLRYRLGEPGAWPLDVAVYGELAELRDEFEVEAKIILQRRLGPMRLIANLWAEREFYFHGPGEWVLHPTAGVTYEFSPRVAVGVEGWLLKEIMSGESSTSPVARYNRGPLGFVGPTLMTQGARVWLSLGAYTRVTTFGRPARIGDEMGRFWVRTMIGIDL